MKTNRHKKLPILPLLWIPLLVLLTSTRAYPQGPPKSGPPKPPEQAPSKQVCGSSEAKARFIELEPEFKRYQDIKLAMPPAILAKKLQEKTGLLATLAQRYQELLRCTDANWSVAAQVRLGGLFDNFAETLRRSPIPDSMPPEQGQMFRDEMKRQSQPLMEKATEAYQQAVDRAKQAGLPPDNEWLVLAGKRLEALRTARPAPANE